MQAGRPPHLIAPDEVDAWIADSVVRVVTSHNTDRRSAEAILRAGVRVDRSRIGAYGQGFYTTTLADPFQGEVEITVAVRLLTPLIGHFDDVDDFMN